jgi:hypothetical protein
MADGRARVGRLSVRSKLAADRLESLRAALKAHQAPCHPAAMTGVSRTEVSRTEVSGTDARDQVLARGPYGDGGPAQLGPS